MYISQLSGVSIEKKFQKDLNNNSQITCYRPYLFKLLRTCYFFETSNLLYLRYLHSLLLFSFFFVPVFALEFLKGSKFLGSWLLTNNKYVPKWMAILFRYRLLHPEFLRYIDVFLSIDHIFSAWTVQ